MTSAHIKNILPLLAALVVLPAWSQGDKPVYRCPGNPVLYTDTLSAKEAKEKGCRTLEGAPITVLQSPKPRTGMRLRERCCPASAGARRALPRSTPTSNAPVTPIRGAFSRAS